MIGHMHISFCRPVNKSGGDLNKPESKLSCERFWWHRSYLGLKWSFSSEFWVNPIGATHSPRQTLFCHPLNSFVVAGEGGTLSGQTRSFLGNRERSICINNNGPLC